MGWVVVTRDLFSPDLHHKKAKENNQVVMEPQDEDVGSESSVGDKPKASKIMPVKQKPAKRQKRHRRIGERRKKHSGKQKKAGGSNDDEESSGAAQSSTATHIGEVETFLETTAMAVVNEIATDRDYCDDERDSSVASENVLDTTDESTLEDVCSLSSSSLWESCTTTSQIDDTTTDYQFIDCEEVTVPFEVRVGVPRDEVGSNFMLEESEPIEESMDVSVQRKLSDALGSVEACGADVSEIFQKSSPVLKTIETSLQSDLPGTVDSTTPYGADIAETTETYQEAETTPLVGTSSNSPILGTRLPKRRKPKPLTVRPKKTKRDEGTSDKRAEEDILDVEGIMSIENPNSERSLETEVVIDLQTDPLPSQLQDEAYKTEDDDSVTSIVSDLCKSLPDAYLVHKVGSSVRILLLNSCHNTNVEKSIYFDCGVVRMYVHSYLVPKDHDIFKSVPYPSTMTPASITQYLSSLVHSLSLFSVCRGITECERLWTESSGHIESILFGARLLRASHCELLVNNEGGRCKECQVRLKSFRKKMKRHADRKLKGKDKAKVPNKYLDRESLEEKSKGQQREKKLDRKTILRLKKRLEKRKDYVKLDDGLQKDFYNVFKKQKLEGLQLEFWKSQLKAIKNKNSKSNKWHPMMIRLGLSLQGATTAEGYSLLRQFVALPSSRRLYDYSHAIEAKEGCQEEILNDIKAKIEKSGSDEHHKFVNVLCDEMHIRAGLVLRRASNDLVGYTNLTDAETEVQKLSDELSGKDYTPSLAKKILVFFATGITNSVSDVVAVYSTRDLSASQLYVRSWEVIYHLELSGVAVLCFICDGASTNIKFIKMHKPFEHPDYNSSFLYATLNIAAPEARPLFFILDPPHLLKTTRNCVANSFAHKKTRNLWKGGEFLSWQVYQQLYNVTAALKFNLHKLTKAHIKLTSFSCMKVLLAAQIFSSSVVNALKSFKDHEAFQDYQMGQLIKLTELMNRFFDVFNGMEVNGKDSLKKDDHRAYTSPDDERFTFLTDEFLHYFDSWQEEVKQRPGFTPKERNRMIISHQTLKALKITVYSFIKAVQFMLEKGAPKVYARLFNQDALEQFFSRLRAMCGSDDHPDLLQSLHSRVVKHVEGNIGLGSRRGNTEVMKRDIVVDSTPLRVRKK